MKEMYRDSERFVFHSVSLFKDRAFVEMCTVLQEN